jgi:CO dehydrogenase/acetyl-CoA synthase alpha subunit
MPIDTKYVGLLPHQVDYAKKMLLYSEMELLSGLKHFQNFKEIRKKEFAVKALLKKASTSLKKELKILDENLPHVQFEKAEIELPEEIQSRQSLDSEIEDLKRKIAELS